ncbi:hypothetical protein NDU88_000075 [Pleurodeles waltl]|uniref:Uncharacterized protein n=1 Tax=Pleurodeles waltl TaxID=8319 RepID=A0AAV7U2F3_PLEWA|nr:hypothetical protein NDU88_000075 [Pleurodeles waltl]
MSEQRRPHDAAYFAEQEDSFLAEDIVHALDASVAQSVNQALAVALQPIARQLKRYALTAPPDGNPRPLSSAGPQGSDSPTQHPWPTHSKLPEKAVPLQARWFQEQLQLRLQPSSVQPEDCMMDQMWNMHFFGSHGLL